MKTFKTIFSGESNIFRKRWINEDFCSLARRVRFLSGGIYEYISSIKNRAQRRQGAKRPLISASFIIYIFIFSIFFISDSLELYRSFPNRYTWGEILINYEGGLVRRGLLGQFLLWVDNVIPVQIFYTSMFCLLFIFFVWFSYKKLAKVFDPLVVAFLFICPGLFLFNLYDINIFGRKYLFIYLIFFGLARLCISCFTKPKYLYRNTLAIALLFIIGFLVYEAIIFQFPLFMVLLGAAYARRQKTVPWLLITGALFFIALFFIVFYAAGSEDLSEAVQASWARRYPDFNSKGGLSYIGIPLKTAITTFISNNSSPRKLGSFLGCLFLSGLPLYVLWKAHGLHKAVQELFSISITLRVSFWLALPALCGYFAVTMDYGSGISHTMMACLFFLYAVFSIQPQPETPWLRKLKSCFSPPPPPPPTHTPPGGSCYHFSPFYICSAGGWLTLLEPAFHTFAWEDLPKPLFPA